MENITNPKTITVDINYISDELYLMIKEEFKKRAQELGIDWNTIEDEYWEISMDYTTKED
jgi:hypothetical protein